MRFLCVLCALCVLGGSSYALDREAFTFTKYDLDVRLEPEQQRLAVRGKINLRNDSTAPQKNIALQVSSSLDWRSIRLAGETLQFETHPYTSDIDHTGALSEAIVTLPHEIAPKGTMELEIGYEGVIPLDATRLTRIGVPEGKAKHIDWDRISNSFTAVRGIGYVAWYPIATEAASLSEASSISETTGKWMAREAQAELSAKLSYSREGGDDASGLYCGGAPETLSAAQKADQELFTTSECSWAPIGLSVPTLVMAHYQTLSVKDVTVRYLSDQKDAAEDYADVASQPDLIVAVGPGSRNLQILALPDHDDTPFVTEQVLLMPLKSALTNEAELNIVYALARQMVSSSRPWIAEGLAHYAQVAFIEAQKGRQAALDYLEAHKAVLVEEEKQMAGKSGPGRSLITAPDDLYLQAKSMYVWWMLSDTTGNVLSPALRTYQASRDTDPAYMQKLLEQKSNRNLQWFFDDWVYYDRGLPDFRVASVFSTPITGGGFLVTIEVENLGSAGGEVPIILMAGSSEIRKRLEVRGKSKASVRIETQAAPTEVTVNDGSVPESDVSNNTFKIESMTH